LPFVFPASREEFVGAVGAGSLGAAELGRAMEAIEGLALHGLIRPYLTGVANELGGVGSGGKGP
jgi:hypothetical protein